MIRSSASRIVLAVIATAALFPLTVRAGDDAPFSLRGVALGITLDQLRAFQMPLQSDMQSNPKLACGEEAQYVVTTPQDQAIGVLRCEWQDTLTVHFPPEYHAAPLPPSIERGQLLVGDGEATVDPTFDLIKDEAGTYRLYRIELESATERWPHIYPSYVEKFGPGNERTVILQNGFGANFPTITNSWSNSTSSILIEERCNGQLTRMCVTYTHAALYERYQMLKKAKAGAPLL